METIETQNTQKTQNTAEVIDSFRGTNKFLSNFSLDTVLYGGILYPTSEHAYQAAKTEDIQLRNFIATQVKTPAEAKSFGNKLKLRENWDAIKINIMREVVFLKFQQHSLLQEKLLETKDSPLVEGNTWGDQFWGTCGGLGDNNLGKILMEVREYFTTSDFWVRLRFLNTLRCNNYFHKIDEWSLLEYSACICGEAGEIVDEVKKTKRGDKPLDILAVTKEVGDVLAYLDLLCGQLNISLEEAVRTKFNIVSQERLNNCQLTL